MTILNDKLIKSVLIPDRASKMYWDSKVTGFGVRVTHSGTKSFMLRYRIGNRERKYVIGKFPDLNTNVAREIAIRMKGQIVQGFDPLESKKQRLNILTVKQLSREFLAVKARMLRKKTMDDYTKCYLGKHILPAFGNRAIDSITKRDIESLINSMSQTPIIANRVLTLLINMFNTAISWDLLKRNPAQGIKKYIEHNRERYLSNAEIKKLVGVLDSDENRINVAIIKLILITGSRKSEVLSARWQDFDFEQKIWIKPYSLTKQNKNTVIPLNSEALKILYELKRNIIFDECEINNLPSNQTPTVSNSKYVFYNPRTQTHVKDIKRFWHNICEKAEINDIRIHDLRHTFASILVNKGVSLEMIGKLVGHANIRTTQRYSHLANNSLREVAEMVSGVVG